MGEFCSGKGRGIGKQYGKKPKPEGPAVWKKCSARQMPIRPVPRSQRREWRLPRREDFPPCNRRKVRLRFLFSETPHRCTTGRLEVRRNSCGSRLAGPPAEGVPGKILPQPAETAVLFGGVTDLGNRVGTVQSFRREGKRHRGAPLGAEPVAAGHQRQKADRRKAARMRFFRCNPSDL